MRQRKIKKRGKLLHVRERSDRTSWGWVREGGSPSRRKFCNFRYWKSCFNAEKNQKKRKIATCEGAQRPWPPGGGFGRGVPPPAENVAILGTENHVLMQRKIKKRGKLLHVRERSDRTSWGWVREGGSPPAENFAILGTENHVLMHFRTTFWGYNVDYLLCLVTLQLKMMIFFFFFFFLFFFYFFFIFIFYFLRMSKSAEIRGSAEKSHACYSNTQNTYTTDKKPHQNQSSYCPQRTILHIQSTLPKSNSHKSNNRISRIIA